MLEQFSFSKSLNTHPVTYEFAKKVLIVDSDSYKSALLEKIIQKQNQVCLGTVNNIDDLERILQQFEPDMIFINLETKGKLDGYQITKILKLDHDIPYSVYFDQLNPNLHKWAKELNPVHLFCYSINEKELDNNVRKALA
ncbi:MAG: hypothetical protein CMO34_06235 [Verrucomicrobia bacterium]|nr:hypothetical protein [Verrucomicrobiota bacterium]